MTESNTNHDGRGSMTINEPLLHETWSQILSDPASWNQGSYGQTTECGTAFCMAGHTAVLTGAEMWMRKSVLSELKGYAEAFAMFRNADYPEWSHANAFHIAQDALGLTDEQAYDLFVWSAGISDLTEMANLITEVTGVEVKAPVDL